MKTVLIIEDNLEIRENLEELLELNGYSILTAKNGKEGIDIINLQFPHMIICDIMMPEVNGYEVIHTLKSNIKTKDIPFVFLTASIERKEIEQAASFGASAYILKPFEPEELLKIVNQWIYMNTPP